MKKPLILRHLLASSLIVFAVGCSTIDSRIKEKSDVYATLTPDQQQVVRNGFIANGFTSDMVYMALDKPEKVIPGSGPSEETWVYHNFYSANGNSITPPTKITSSASGMGARGGQAAAAASRFGYNNTHQVDYDFAAENIKSESAIKVHVKFTDGKVSEIQIINNGKV